MLQNVQNRQVMLDFEARCNRGLPTLNTIKRIYEKYLGHDTSLNRNKGNSGLRATVVTAGKIDEVRMILQS